MDENFEPPATQVIAALSKKSHGVSSGNLQILDAKTLIIPDLTYNGAGKGNYLYYINVNIT